MVELTAGRNDAGQRLDKFLSKAFPNIPPSLLYKGLRTNKIKVNRKRPKADYHLQEGDSVCLYFQDALLYHKNQEEDFRSLTVSLRIVYEDENVLLADKPAGMLCHSDHTESYNTLISHIKAYLYQRGEYDPDRENSFVPSLCNRIDRNTSGIVIAAKNAETLRILNQKIKDRELTKLYRCLVLGEPQPPEAHLTGFLYKDAANNQVTVRDEPFPGALRIETAYQTLKTDGELSLLEVELLTGRTHQIRAHLAHIGHPLLGDSKYGFTRDCRKYGFIGQALCAYQIKFDFRTDAGILNYLSGRAFQVQEIPFLNRITL